MPTKSSLLGNEKNIQSDKDEALEEARDYYDFYRPVMVSLRHCTNVLLSGVTFMNSPAWNIHPFFCENVTIDNIKVRNPYYAQNGDGIDVESCTNVHIHHSVFETGDDAICIKAGKNAIARTIDGPCSNIYIHDCVVNEGHGGFVIGSEMSRGVKDILVENCTFIGTDVGVRIKSALGRGGVVENITIRNIDMVNIKGEAVILTMGYVLNLLNRNETIAMDNEEDVPYFRNIDMMALCVQTV
ncbi:MAG: glycoside hydrolase family 28 protein [Lachnospira pectinoschiza]